MSKHNSTGLGKPVTVTIDGKICQSTYGKTILQVARENGIYIPTMCYLTKTQPIASCRMCLVDVEGVDGAILSCQEKAVDGAVVTTQNLSLYKERQNIMKLYNVNHPLECGVCDQSGECDLQNKTLEFDVAIQNFTAREPHRPVENWGHVSYDPALCIMCERCVRVSMEITGDEALVLKFGGYSSTILNVKQEKNYSSLGEAAAVCPVGALVDARFKYTANAWELTKIPSSCSHCSGGCQLNYEVKKDTIYRVTNNAEFATLCGAGRYGYKFANTDVRKDREAFARAVDAVAHADTILLSATISNEEALILQKIKERQHLRLVCPEARGYQKFLNAYSKVSGKKLYGGTLEALSSSRGIIVFGSRINDDAPLVKYHITMASKWHRARVAYLHPVADSEIQNIITQSINYAVGSEEAVAALLADAFVSHDKLPKTLQVFFDQIDNDKLFNDAQIKQEAITLLKQSFHKKTGFSLVVGSDLYSHPRVENIAKLIALLEQNAGFNVIAIPPATNALGVAMICDLDDEAKAKSVGYNVKGDFTLSAMGDGDLDMPAMNQQEGTITNIEKRVVPMNVALSYGGYVLNDITNALGFDMEYTIDYTPLLPSSTGYKAERFDDLPDYYDVSGNAHRGYFLQKIFVPTVFELEAIATPHLFDKAVVYLCNSGDQFSPFTYQCEVLEPQTMLRGSQHFAQNYHLQEGQKVSFKIDGVLFERLFMIDASLEGFVAITSYSDMGLSAGLLSSYRFCGVELHTVTNEESRGNKK